MGLLSISSVPEEIDVRVWRHEQLRLKTVYRLCTGSRSTGPTTGSRSTGQPPAPGPRVQPPAPGPRVRPPAHGSHHRLPVHGSNHRLTGQPPAHGSTTGSRVNHRLTVHGSTTGSRLTGPTTGSRLTGPTTGSRSTGQPPAHGSTTSSRVNHQLTGQPPAHGSTTSSRVNHQLTGQPPAHGTRVNHRDPYTKVQDSELKIAASAHFLGTTTRQLELLAAPTARALPNGLTRAGTPRAPPGQGEHRARSLHVPLFVEFRQEPYCTACFLGRPPTHSGRHSLNPSSLLSHQCQGFNPAG
ncbi:unnamed protein product [Arctogadus glacialis]